MTASARAAAHPSPAEEVRDGLPQWLLTTDHKRIGLLTIGTALFLFFFNGAVALTMRAQLAQPDQDILSPQSYLQFMTMHGTGMIAVTITPLALGLGVYLVPLQVGAPRIAAPRATLLGYWLYVAGAIMLIWGFLTPDGAADGWWGYTPLSNTVYLPGPGRVAVDRRGLPRGHRHDPAGRHHLVDAAAAGAPGVTMMRMPVFCWTQLVTCLMVAAAFPALLAADAIVALDRLEPSLFSGNFWNITYENMFWFYGHPVVYVMFFPFVGCVAESLSTFSGRRFFAYKGTVLSLLVFATGHGGVGTPPVRQRPGGQRLLLGDVDLPDHPGRGGVLRLPRHDRRGRLRYTTSMLFALAFIPQFLIGGLTGILVANPAIDYHVNNSYFILGHFHYTLFAGSVFGFFAGFVPLVPQGHRDHAPRAAGQAALRAARDRGEHHVHPVLLPRLRRHAALDGELSGRGRVHHPQPDLQHRRGHHRPGHGGLRV